MDPKWNTDFGSRVAPRSSLLLLILDEAASTVSVYYPGPKLCIGYLIPKGKCTENPCKYFHLCRNFSMGCCHFGENCRYSHDVKSPHNQRIVLQNGLDDFSDHEILRLIELSTPRVCRDYNQGGCKYGDACRRLHICSRLVRNSCLKSPEACFNHDKNSPQCKNILGAYHLQKNPNVFKFLYTEPEEGKTKVQKQPEHKRSYSGDIEPVMEEVAPGSVEELRSSHHVVENPPAKEEVKQPLMEDDSSCYSDPDITEICEAYLRGECYSTESCKRHHYQLPYLWQVLLDGNWISLDKDGTNQMIEQAFSRPECKDIQITSGCKVHSGGNTVVIRIIDFNTMKATLGLTVRRLSTPSYVQVKEAEKEEATVGNMTTQWRWYWQDNGYKTDRRGNLVENWMMYEQVDGGAPYQSVIELKFLHGQKKYIFQHGQFIYSLNMSKMYQKNWETGKMRAVVRRPLFFGSKCLASPSRHLPTILDEAPSHWFPIDTASDYEMIPLEESSVKYKETEKMFMGSIGNQHYEVKKVYQVQNPYQWHKYCSKKKFLLSKLGDNLNEKQLFHGSDSFEVIKAICKQNFDARVSGKNAVMYGEGCYFAKTAKYSNNYTDRNSHRQYMFLARVLVGMYVQGQKGLKRPPSVNPAKLESDLYNSCVDNTMSPSIFVIFDHDQSYPEYLIEYTCTQPDSEFSPLQLSNPYSSANFSSTSPVHVPPPAPARPNLPSDVYATHSSNVYAAGSSTPWQTTQSSQERFGQSPRQNRPNLHKTNTDKNCCIQ
ncbi:poly [ADP-ribose] polymerase 12 [Lingula anatina]|uniref:Poly [ADP-ribose] polymerase 12 n=1 Tax=Lingula anatina TaxID=7574 RepID=A0A1S3HI52_LINAN|nr:poly [ADP-ribose] polymerase 12 [Lingula anatina]|eukprot:XP_013385156.1 poly [ADP-ribose] polymerase 12 [Lingula anatina]